MTIKELLLQEIDSTPNERLEYLLDFLQSLKIFNLFYSIRIDSLRIRFILIYSLRIRFIRFRFSLCPLMKHFQTR